MWSSEKNMRQMAIPWKTVSLVFCISSPLSPSVTVCLKLIRHVVCHFIFRNRTNSVRIESPNDGITSTITPPLYGTALLAHIKKGYSPCSTADADAPSNPYPSYFNHDIRQTFGVRSFSSKMKDMAHKFYRRTGIQDYPLTSGLVRIIPPHDDFWTTPKYILNYSTEARTWLIVNYITLHRTYLQVAETGVNLEARNRTVSRTSRAEQRRLTRVSFTTSLPVSFRT